MYNNVDSHAEPVVVDVRKPDVSPNVDAVKHFRVRLVLAEPAHLLIVADIMCIRFVHITSKFTLVCLLMHGFIRVFDQSSQRQARCVSYNRTTPEERRKKKKNTCCVCYIQTQEK